MLYVKTETVSISIPSWLWEAIKTHCDRHSIKYSQFLTEAAKKWLLVKMDTAYGLDLWNQIIRDD